MSAMYTRISTDDCQAAIDLIDSLDSSCFSVVEHNGEWALSCDDEGSVVNVFTAQELRALVVRAVAYEELTSLGIPNRLGAPDGE